MVLHQNLEDRKFCRILKKNTLSHVFFFFFFFLWDVSRAAAPPSGCPEPCTSSGLLSDPQQQELVLAICCWLRGKSPHVARKADISIRMRGLRVVKGCQGGDRKLLPVEEVWNLLRKPRQQEVSAKKRRHGNPSICFQYPLLQEGLNISSFS